MAASSMISTGNPVEQEVMTYFLPTVNISGTLKDSAYVTIPTGLLDQGLFDLLNMLITQLTLPVIEVFGIMTNSINLIVFWSIGLNDSVSSSFFALSLSDLCYLLAAFFVWLCFTLGSELDLHRVNLDQMGYLGVWHCHMLLAVSIFITTYIAIQRCCCVAMPLKFKGVFTSRKNVLVFCVICLASASLYVPIMSHQGMKHYVDEAKNVTRYGLWFSKNRKSVLVVTDLVAGTLFPIVTQVVTVVCMVILISSLRRSSRFRQESTSNTQYASSEAKSNSKEVQVVKAVTTVTIMFIASNTAPICIALTRRVVPSFDMYKTYDRLFQITNVIKDAVQYLNASMNIVVYYHFNSSYRAILKQILVSKLVLRSWGKQAQ